MPDEYALYEAKARSSSLLRQVREGRWIIITVHSVPAAELRPVDQTTRLAAQGGAVLPCCSQVAR